RQGRSSFAFAAGSGDVDGMYHTAPRRRVTSAAMGPDRRTVRAVAIALAIGAGAVDAIPDSAGDLNSPEAAAERRAWSATLSPVGVRVDEAGLLVATPRAIAASRAVHDALEWPIRPLVDATQTGERWSLFSVPEAMPTRLEVLVAPKDGAWKVLYRALDGK